MNSKIEKFENLVRNTFKVALKVNMLHETFTCTLTLKGLKGFNFPTPVVKLFANIVNNSLIMNTL